MDEENRNEATTNNSPIAIAPDQMHQLTEEEEKKLKEAIQRNRVPSLHANRIIYSCFRMYLWYWLSTR